VLKRQAFSLATCLAFFSLLAAGDTASLTLFNPPKYNQEHKNTTAKLNPQYAKKMP